MKTAEHHRLEEARQKEKPWKKWGPYLTERQWGTERENYSDNGDAWNFFTHDHARSRAYRVGKDGIGGISDDEQHRCFALALCWYKSPQSIEGRSRLSWDGRRDAGLGRLQAARQ
jgi:hypothetical protein